MSIIYAGYDKCDIVESPSDSLKQNLNIQRDKTMLYFKFHFSLPDMPMDELMNIYFELDMVFLHGGYISKSSMVDPEMNGNVLYDTNHFQSFIKIYIKIIKIIIEKSEDVSLCEQLYDKVTYLCHHTGISNVFPSSRSLRYLVSQNFPDIPGNTVEFLNWEKDTFYQIFDQIMDILTLADEICFFIDLTEKSSSRIFGLIALPIVQIDNRSEFINMILKFYNDMKIEVSTSYLLKLKPLLDDLTEYDKAYVLSY